MPGRVRLVAAVALAAAAVLAGALLLAGSSEGGDGDLAWKDVQYLKAGRATDRILYGRLRSTSLEDIKLDVHRVTVLDAEGGKVRSAVVFLPAFAHGIYPWDMRGEASDFERRRLGQIATLKPGQSIPITLSWRVPKGGRQPAKVDFGPAELALP